MRSNTAHFLLLSLLATNVSAMEQVQQATNTRLDPLGDGISSLELLTSNGDDLQIVNAARVSYARHSTTFSDADKRILTTLISSGHETPFEQTFLQYHVRLPLFVARQWMRHRVGVSYNEQSARYTQMEEEFYIPANWRNNSTSYKQLDKEKQDQTDAVARATYTKALETSMTAYRNLLAASVPKELARGVLPVSLYTQFVFACNVRSLFHFVKLRADSHAQWEIQQYAKGLLQLARTHFPVSIDIWCRIHNVTWLDEKPALEMPPSPKTAHAEPTDEKAPAEQLAPAASAQANP
jgi:thymidylate synthase (FAD)